MIIAIFYSQESEVKLTVCVSIFIYFLSLCHERPVEKSHFLKPLYLPLFSACIWNIKYLKRIRKIKSSFICSGGMIYTILNKTVLI